MIVLSAISTSLLAESAAPIRSPEAIEGATKINSEELIELVNEVTDVVLVDSRLTTNRTFGYIEGSISLPDIDTNCKTLKTTIPSFENAAVFYCNGPKCGRSEAAVRVAIQCGYTNVYWFRGGIEAWRQKHYPLVIN